MKKWATDNCTVYQVLDGRSNSFLISSSDNFILIDTGRKNSEKKLTNRVNDIVGNNRLSCLILTHTHFDHAENGAKMKNLYDCPVIVHESEAEYLNVGNSPLPKGTNLATGFLVDKFRKKARSRYKYEPLTPDIVVDERYDLDPLGFNAYIIHTPGHSVGSISVVIDDTIAVVGDAMFGVFGNSIYPPFADNPKLLIKSWSKLLETGCKLFLPGHGKEISKELLYKKWSKMNND
jgi:hydroxyacylglutathione hydrolase